MKETLSEVLSFIFVSLLIVSFFGFSIGCFFGCPSLMAIGGIGLIISCVVICPIWCYVKFGSFFYRDIDFWD